MRLYNVYGKLVNKNVIKYKVDWDKPCRSKIQFNFKSFFKDYLNQKDLKGEIVLLIEGSSGEKTIHIDEGIKKSYLEKLSPKDAAKLLALVLNKSKREIYNSLIDS